MPPSASRRHYLPALSRLYCLALALALAAFPSRASTIAPVAAFSPSARSAARTATFRMSASPPFALNVKFQVKPSREGEFLKTIKKDLRETLSSEPNALQFVLGRDVDDPRTYYLHEEYRSRSDHADTHSNAEYFQECLELFASDPFVEPPVIDEFALLHDAPAAKVKNVEAVCLNVELCIKPEVREEFLAVIRQNKAGSVKEPLCLQYSWGESVNVPNTFHFHEQYVGEEGVAAHNAAPHFAVWEEFASKGNPFSKSPVVQKYKTILDK